jgi:hypothetical protein
MEYRIEYPNSVTFIRNKKVIATPELKQDCVEFTIHDGGLNIAYVIDDLQRRGLEFDQVGNKIRMSFGMVAVLLMRLKQEKPGIFKKVKG